MIAFAEGARPCPVCGATEARVFVEARFEQSELDAMSFSSRKVPEGLYHRLLECAQCDLLYASPVPTFESLTDAYRQADYASSEEARYAAATYAKVLETITPQLPDLRGAADIGAGDGAFLERLRAAGFEETVGFEPSEAPLAAAPPSVRNSIRPEPFSAGVLPDESFTLVSCMQTIEHVLDPLEVCRTRCARSHRGRSADRVSRPPRAECTRPQATVPDLRHRARPAVSPRSIRALLLRAGLKPIEVRPLSNRYPMRYWLQLAPLPERLEAALGRLLAAGRLVDRPVGLRVGNLVAVGYKPA